MELTKTGYIMPQASEVEDLIIGCILSISRAFEIAARLLQFDDFHTKTNQLIFNCCANLFISGNPIDLYIINEELTRTNEIEQVGGISHLINLANKVGSDANLEYHCFIVLQKSIARKVIQYSSEAIKKSFEGNDFEDEIRLELIGKLEGIRIPKPKMTNQDIVLKIANQRAGNEQGLMTGYKDIDYLTQGLEGLIILAARPGMGKSILALNIAKNISSKKIPILFFSFEMSTEQVIRRIICSEIEVAVTDIKKGMFDLSKTDFNIGNYRLEIYDDASLTVDDVVAISKQKLGNEKEGSVIIDYLQIMSPSINLPKGSNKNAQIEDMTRKLKKLNLYLKKPVIALSQLSRSVESRGGDHRPNLGDLRDSGAIEQDADMVAFIYRPSYYGIEGDDNLAEVIWSKNRDGQCGTVELDFIGKYMKFIDRKSDVSFESLISNELINRNSDIPF